MIAAARIVPACLLGLAACAEIDPVGEGVPDLVGATIEPLGETSFAVSITALNTDGYELARCIAAGYAASRREEEGRDLYGVFRRQGGRLIDEFRVVDGVRMQRTTGLQTYAFDPELTPADHDGRDVMAVDVQLSRCEKAGLPTGAE